MLMPADCLAAYGTARQSIRDVQDALGTSVNVPSPLGYRQDPWNLPSGRRAQPAHY